MNGTRFYQIFLEDPSRFIGGDNAYMGLAIIAKYLSPTEYTLITRAEHDVIFSVSIAILIQNGITEDDVSMLRDLRWSLSDDGDELLYSGL